MRYIKTLALLLGCFMLCSLSVEAKKEKKAAKEKPAPVVYAFGHATQFTDTVITMTAIQVLPGAELENKSKFLKYRAYYAEQLQAHLATEKEVPTCCIFFDTNKTKLEKKFVKLRRKAQARGAKFYKELSKEDFQFMNVTGAESVQ